MVRAEGPLHVGPQCGELIPRGGPIPGQPGARGELEPGFQGVRVVRAEIPLPGGHQRGQLIPRPRRICVPPA